jgi:hypothetical protein
MASLDFKSIVISSDLLEEGKKLAEGIISDAKELMREEAPSLSFLSPPCKTVVVEPIINDDWSSFATLLLSQLNSQKITRRKDLLEKLLAVANPPSFDVWTLQNGWEVGTVQAVANRVIGFFSNSKGYVEKFHDIRVEPITLAESKHGLRAIFFFYRNGVETFDGCKIVRTGENEYFYKEEPFSIG